MSPPATPVPSHPRTDAHWHEYPLTGAWWLAAASARVLIWAMSAVGAGQLLIFAINLLGEQDLLPSETLTRTVDLFGRKGLLVAMLWLALMGMVCTWCVGVRARCTTRALVRAAREGAPATAVPAPHQVEDATEPAYGGFFVAACWICGMLSFFTAIGWAVMLGDVSFDQSAVLVGLVVATILAVVPFSLALVLRSRGRAAQRAERPLIAAHWCPEDEAAAWARATPVNQPRTGPNEQEATPLPGRLLRYAASGLAMVSATGIALAILLFYAIVIVAYPEHSLAAHHLGPRQHFGTVLDSVIHGGDWGVSVMLVVSALGFVSGSVLLGMADRRSTAALMALTTSASESRTPSIETEAAVAGARQSPGIGPLALGSLGALVVQLGGTFLVIDDPSMSEGTAQWQGMSVAELPAFAFPLIAPGVLLMVLAVVWGALQLARTRERRCLIMAHWPVRPQADKDDPRARRGPALTPQSDDDDDDHDAD